MQNMHWKILIIAVALLISLWSLTSYGLRYGKDLAGGLSLVYEVYLQDGDNPDDIIPQTIDVVSNRLNPHGTFDISIIRQGRNRIEIIMPLPSEEVKAARDAFEARMAELLREARLNPADIRTALAEGTLIERYGPREDLEGTPSMVELQQAFDRRQAAIDAYEALQQDPAADPAALDAAIDEAAAAELAFDESFASVLASSLKEAEVRRMLEMQIEASAVRDRETEQKERDAEGNVIKRSPRDLELERLRAQYPAAAQDLQAVVDAWDAYARLRRGFDDAEDLKRLMRGAGVLEFRIAVQPGTTDQGFNIQQLRDDLQQRGPEVRTSTVVFWAPINDLEQWYDRPSELEALLADPVSYFERFRLVAAEFGGEYYVLLYDRNVDKLTHEVGQRDWSLRSAGRAVDRLGRPAVSFSLDAAGGTEMGRLTGQNLQEPMAIVLDGEVYSAPNINSRIGGEGIIEGTFSEQEISYLIRVLASGSLGARLSEDPISENKLGPSIGADNLTRGLYACAFGVIAVAMFMLLYYFFAGAVADAALICNGLLIFGIMSMQQASFTLPGIAGIVLTIGMAVDANVLIYERIREELFAGEEDLRTAIRVGYNKALSTIIDGNVTNLIVCLVLYQTATAEVKGFALTLGIGILATLFTALFVTRVIFTLYTDFFKRDRLPMLATVFPAVHRALEPNINWIALRKVFVPLSVVLVVASLGLVFFFRGEMLDTEFRGGVSATMLTRHENPADESEGRIMLDRAEVERRVHALGAGVIDPTDPLYPLRFADVLSAGGNQENGRSDSFQIKVALPEVPPDTPETRADQLEAENMGDIVSAIVQEFDDVVESTPPVTFAGDDRALPPSDAVFPVNRHLLGDVIDREGYDTLVDEYRGGVAVVIDQIEPGIKLEDARRRIGRMRLQPDFAVAASRQWEVFGLDVNEAGEYTSIAVIAFDPQYPYEANQEIWRDQVQQVEWSLVREALTEDATLESVNTYSASVAEALKANAAVAIILSLLGILVYIWIRFGSLLYSAAAVAALLHDSCIALGLLAATHFLGGTGFLGLEVFRIDLGVLAALLTIIGYSLNDTIVILDRIRENRGKRRLADAATINRSINQTISRTVLTSGTTLLAVAIMYIAGGTGIRPFAFCLFVGILVGTYSTVAVAAPLVFRRRGGTEGGLISSPGGDEPEDDEASERAALTPATS